MRFRLLSLMFCCGFGCESAETTTVALRTSSAAADNDWPNWMGPDHDGVSDETGWSTDWPADDLPLLWDYELGTGFSSVSIVDGLLYSMGHERGQETVWCLNADTGDVVWSHSYDAEKNPNLYEGGPGATPTVDGEFVYTLSVDGRLLCLNRQAGDVVWEKELLLDLDVRMHEWGFNASPYILDDQLILEAGRVVSYDKRTGNKNWQTERHPAGYGSVSAFSVDGESLVASLDCAGLRITSARDGSAVAFTAWKSPYRTNSTTPIIVGDRIFISTGYNVGCGLFHLRRHGTESSLVEVYSSKEMRNHFNNCVLLDGFLYGFDGNSNLGRVVTLKCMDASTGGVQWTQRGLGCGSLMIADGKLVILTDKGQLVVAAASPTGFVEQSRSAFLSGKCWTVPVLLNGRIYGRNARGRLACVKLPRSS
jgi:outer membrane protein assembly factor BamB